MVTCISQSFPKLGGPNGQPKSKNLTDTMRLR